MSSLTLADHREQAFGNLPRCLCRTVSTRPGARTLRSSGSTLHQAADATRICTWAHGPLGKTERGGHRPTRNALPRSALRQIHKRGLRDRLNANTQGH